VISFIAMMNRFGLSLCILIAGLLLLGLPLANGVVPQVELPKCPIGIDKAPYLKNPHIASGGECRGACGEDCPSDRCDEVKDIEIPVFDTEGNEYKCVYKNVINCLSHEACKVHDACYDKCAEEGYTVVWDTLSGGPDECHDKCNQDCFKKWGETQCVVWADIAGYRADYYYDPEYDSVMLFSDPPELVWPEETWHTWAVIDGVKCLEMDVKLRLSGSSLVIISPMSTSCSGNIFGKHFACHWTYANSKNDGEVPNDRIEGDFSFDGKSFEGVWEGEQVQYSEDRSEIVNRMPFSYEWYGERLS
jgi:hypothetical protein